MTMEEQGKLSQWLKKRCEHLSLREAAAKTGLSYTTIGQVINGTNASPQTLRKLAQAFADGTKGRLALEDKLLVLAGYRTQRPQGEEPSELLAQLIDKVKQFNEPQLKIMGRFADFLTEIEEERQ
ncbi:hypothetical protein ES703_60161 [subsurface metagenome]